MAVVSIFTVMLLFSLFLALGLISKRIMKWIYFTLSCLCLITAIFFITSPQWSTLSGFQNKNSSQPSSIPNLPDKNGGNEKSPENNPPQADEPEKDPVPPDSQDKPAPPLDKIVLNENEKVDYKVMKGDTLWSVSVRSGVPVNKIKQWNNLNTDVIYIGQHLILYGKNMEPASPASPPKQEIVPSVLVSNGYLQKKEIALTFDAGSDTAGIQILDVLRKHNIKATFFLTGKWVEKFPEYAKQIAQEGHEIGNHSYSHPDAVKTTSTAFIQDILKAEDAIKKVTGKSPRPYFRFPYGSYNASALKAVGEAGYPLSIQWSLDTIDWQQPASEVIISRIEQGASNGDIILMHIGGIHTPDAVDKVIPILLEKGYKLVTLSELLKH